MKPISSEATDATHQGSPLSNRFQATKVVNIANGAVLFMSDGSDSIRVLSPRTLTVERSVHVRFNGAPVRKLNELEYVGGALLSNVYETDLTLRALGRGQRGLRGTVVQVGSGLIDNDLERRLLEIGFVEGAHVEILHTGPIGGDPLAIRIDDMRVAVRRRDADAILIRIPKAGAEW